jgi:hypothetical protein
MLDHFDLKKQWAGTPLLQPPIHRLGLLQDWNFGIGVFPEGEEILVGGERTNAGGIGNRSLRSFRL